jgi:hypothetical protein
VFARLLRGTAGIAALAPLALAVLSAPALGQPSISWNTYLGRQGALDGGTGMSNTDELVKSVPTNALGEVFVAGDSFDSFVSATDTQADAFVSKFNADGSLAWTRMFGGFANDFVNWAVLAPSGTLYVVGSTESPIIRLIATQETIPTKGAHSLGTRDAFVARVNQEGQLTAFVYLGGGGEDRGYALAVDPSDENKVYVVGKTSSDSFPGTNGGRPNGVDGFVSLVDFSRAEPITWSRYLGSTSVDTEGDEVDTVVVQGGSLYLGGVVRGAVQGIRSPSNSSYQGKQEGFVAKLSTSGSFEWIAYLGGREDDAVTDVLARPDGGLVVVGKTRSTNFPAPGSAEAAFVLRMNEQGTPEGTGLRLGDGGVEVDRSCAAMDSLGNVYIGGKTSSTSSLFGLNSFDNTFNAPADGFILMVDAKVENVLWSSYVGGSSSSADEWVRGVSAGPRGQLTLGGGSYSSDLLKADAGYDLQSNGGRDGFVFRLEVDPSDPLVGGVDAGLSPQGLLTPSWEGFSDPQTGIIDYAWALTSGGGLDGGVLERDFQSVGTERFVSPADGVQLAEGKTYFVTVRASNGVGRTSTATSEGVQWTPEPGGGNGPVPIDPRSPFGCACGSTGGGGLVGALWLGALALLRVRHARRAPGSER